MTQYKILANVEDEEANVQIEIYKFKNDSYLMFNLEGKDFDGTDLEFGILLNELEKVIAKAKEF